MNRRGFLGALFAGVVVASLPASAIRFIAPELFTLYGDGIRDDSLALQALFDGKKVLYKEEILQAQTINGHEVFRIPSATFLVQTGGIIIGKIRGR